MPLCCTAHDITDYGAMLLEDKSSHSTRPAAAWHKCCCTAKWRNCTKQMLLAWRRIIAAGLVPIAPAQCCKHKLSWTIQPRAVALISNSALSSAFSSWAAEFTCHIVLYPNTACVVQDHSHGPCAFAPAQRCKTCLSRPIQPLDSCRSNTHATCLAQDHSP